MTTPTSIPSPVVWETAGTSRVPFAVYTSAQLHQRELERFFYRAHWNYVGLEAGYRMQGTSNAPWWASAR